MDAKKFYEDQLSTGNICVLFQYLDDDYLEIDIELRRYKQLFFLMENYARLYHELNK